MQYRFGDDHKERGGDAFAGNISNDEGNMVFVYEEAIIEITTNSFGGYHHSG